MLLAAILATFGVVLLTQAQPTSNTCWRDTPCDGPSHESFYSKGQYNYSPLNRSVVPVSLVTANGSTPYGGRAYPLTGKFSNLVFDFGKEVGGIVHIEYNATRSGAFVLGFSEAKNWTGPYSDHSNGAFNTNGSGYADVWIRVYVAGEGGGTYTLPDAQMRGGFRYVTLFSFGIVANFTNITCEISFRKYFTLDPLSHAA